VVQGDRCGWGTMVLFPLGGSVPLPVVAEWN
jgi:hypothetical protein